MHVPQFPIHDRKTKNERSGAYGTYGGERCVQGFRGGNVPKRDNMEEQTVDEIILK